MRSTSLQFLGQIRRKLLEFHGESMTRTATMIEALSSRCDMRDTAKYVVNSLNWRPRGLNTILHNTGIRTCHKKLQPQISHQIEYKTFCGLNILKYFVLSCLLGFSLSVTHIIPVCMVHRQL